MKTETNTSNNIFKQSIHQFLILLSNCSHNSITLERREILNDISEGSCGKKCANLRTLGVLILILLSITFCSCCIWYLYWYHKTNTLNKGIQPSLLTPEPTEYATIIDIIDENYEKAEKFTRDYPPDERLPPVEHILFIQRTEGATAWVWDPDEKMIMDQIIATID